MDKQHNKPSIDLTSQATPTLPIQSIGGLLPGEEVTDDIDYVNIGDIVPGGIVKDSVHSGSLGYTYSYASLSKTNSTVVRYVLQTGDFIKGAPDGSVYVVDIGGNCGFCRSYIPAGDKSFIMFGWEVDGCQSGTAKYRFESSSWYAFEQGRVRVISGDNKGKDYLYLKIDGQLVCSFYGQADSRPPHGANIYIEATNNLQVLSHHELCARYYINHCLYLERPSQKGFSPKEPPHPHKSGFYFMGWFTAEEGGTLFNFSDTKLTDSISLYARYTDASVTAAFKPSNGSQPFTIKAGKGCLVPEPPTPSYSDGRYPYVFVGWKNESTGHLFDFSSDRLQEDAVFTAQYREKEYYVKYYVNGKYIHHLSFVRSHPTVSGREPSVPVIPNAVGVWEEHPVSGLSESFTINAIYSAIPPSAGSSIKLCAYEGGTITLTTDSVRDYLSTDLSGQTAYVRAFCSSPHDFHDHQKTHFTWTDSDCNTHYTVYFADNREFRKAYIITTDKSSLTDEVGFFTPGKTYYWFVYGHDSQTSSTVDSFTVLDRPVRFLTAGGVTNMRDMGGYLTEDGYRVKYGMVYRGGSLDEYHSHIDDKARMVFSYLGMKSEIELRGEAIHPYTGWDEYNPNVFCVRGVGYVPVLDLDEEQKVQHKAAFEAMANEENYPFYFHCSAGADRTGSFGYLLGGLLGIPYEDLRRDYELSSFSEVGLRTADLFLKESFDEMNRLMLSRFGDGSGNLQTAVTRFLTGYIGVSASVVEKIRSLMLSGEKIQS